MELNVETAFRGGEEVMRQPKKFPSNTMSRGQGGLLEKRSWKEFWALGGTNNREGEKSRNLTQ